MSYFSIPRSGLVGEWLLDGSPNDTNDGTKNNGTFTNPVYVNCPVGYQKQWGSFNGSNSYVDIGYRSAFEFGATSNFEFHVNISCTGTRTAEVPFGFTDFGTASKNWVCIMDAGGRPTLQLFPTGGGSYVLTPNAAVNDGKPHALRFVHRSDKSCEIWIDGKLDVSGVHSLNGNYYTAVNKLAIGAAWAAAPTSAFLSQYVFGGEIGAPRVFNRVLSDVEYNACWHEFNRRLGGGSDFGAAVPAPVHHGLGPKNDDVANTVATTSGSPGQTNDMFGIYSGAESFNGTPRRQRYAGQTAIVSGSSRTMFVLCKGNTTPASVPIGPAFEYGFPLRSVNGAGSRSIGFNWNYTTGFPTRFRAWNLTNSGGTSYSAQYASLSSSVWYVLALSIDTAGNTIRAFKDGIFETATAIAGTIEEVSQIELGGDNNIGNFDGDVAEWAIFPGALSDAQVKYVSESMRSGRYPYAFRRSIPPNLISKARFYAPDARYNVAQTGYNLSLTGSPGTVKALQNSGISTADSGSYYSNSGNLPGCALQAGNSYTMACWAKTGATGTGTTLLELRTNEGPLAISLFAWNGTYQANWSRLNVADHFTNSGVAVDANKWRHIAATFSSGVTRMYVDGYLAATGAYADSNGVGSAIFTGLSVARGVTGQTIASDHYLTNSALSQEEIRQLMYSTYRN